MSKKSALIAMFFLLGSVLIVHFLIFVELIPYDKVWAGKLKSVEEMRAFETFSILINLFMLIVLIIKYKLLKTERNNKIIDVLIWLFAALFLLNTIGNLFAQSMLELVLGTLLTLTSAILCFTIVRKEKPEEQLK